MNRSAVRRLAGQDDFGNSIRSTKAIGHGIGHHHVQRIAGSSAKNISHPSGMLNVLLKNDKGSRYVFKPA